MSIEADRLQLEKLELGRDWEREVDQGWEVKLESVARRPRLTKMESAARLLERCRFDGSRRVGGSRQGLEKRVADPEWILEGPPSQKNKRSLGVTEQDESSG